MVHKPDFCFSKEIGGEMVLGTACFRGLPENDIYIFEYRFPTRLFSYLKSFANIGNHFYRMFMILFTGSRVFRCGVFWEGLRMVHRAIVGRFPLQLMVGLFLLCKAVGPVIPRVDGCDEPRCRKCGWYVPMKRRSRMTRNIPVWLPTLGERWQRVLRNW